MRDGGKRERKREKPNNEVNLHTAFILMNAELTFFPYVPRFLCPQSVNCVFGWMVTGDPPGGFTTSSSQTKMFYFDFEIHNSIYRDFLVDANFKKTSSGWIL